MIDERNLGITNPGSSLFLCWEFFFIGCHFMPFVVLKWEIYGPIHTFVVRRSDLKFNQPECMFLFIFHLVTGGNGVKSWVKVGK